MSLKKIFYFLIRLSALVLGFLINLVIIKFEGYKVLGIFNYTLSLFNILGTVARTGFDNIFLWEGGKLYNKNRKYFYLLYNQLFLLLIVNIAVASLLGFFLLKFVLNIENFYLSLLISIGLLFIYIYSYLIAEFFRVLQNFFLFTAFQSLTLVYFLFLIIYCFFYFSKLNFYVKDLALLVFSLIGFIIFLIGYMFFIKGEIKISLKSFSVKKIILLYKKGFLYTANNLIWLIFGWTDLLVLKFFVSWDYIAVYSFLLKLLVFYNFVYQAYVTPLPKELEYNKDLTSIFFSYKRKLFILSSLIAIPYIFIGLILIHFYFEKAKINFLFVDISFITLTINKILRFSWGPAEIIFYFLNLEKEVTKFLMIALILNLILNFILIDYFNIWGASLATLISVNFFYFLLYKNLIKFLKDAL